MLSKTRIIIKVLLKSVSYQICTYIKKVSFKAKDLIEKEDIRSVIEKTFG